MKSFSFYRAEKFKTFEENKQEQLKGLQDERYNPTKIIDADSNLGKYKVYSVHFDKMINQEGYLYLEEQSEPQSFDHFFKTNKFDCLYDSNQSVVFFECSYKISDAMLKSINALDYTKKDKNTDIMLNKINIDLKKIVRNVPHIIGAWFSDLNQKNLSAAQSSGVDVDQSTLYRQLIKKGKLSSITVVIEVDKDNFTCIISKNGSFTIMNDIKDSSVKLKIIEKMSDILDL